MPKEVELHPRALEEARAAFRWYQERSGFAAKAFIEEIDLALARIAKTPDRWPLYHHGARRCLLRRFPFFIVYRQTEEKIQVIAVAHGRRRPGYWEPRLPY